VGSGVGEEGSEAAGLALDRAAAKVAAFCDELPELDTDVVALLLQYNPAVVAAVGPAEARAKLEEISQRLGLDLNRAARLVARIPAAWNRSEASVSQVRP
jgi:hypothetical protein